MAGHRELVGHLGGDQLGVQVGVLGVAGEPGAATPHPPAR
jgi:hypothetical protein